MLMLLTWKLQVENHSQQGLGAREEELTEFGQE